MKHHEHSEYLKAIDYIGCNECGILLYKHSAKQIKYYMNKCYYCSKCAPPYDEMIEYKPDVYSGLGYTPLPEPIYYKKVQVDKDGNPIKVK